MNATPEPAPRPLRLLPAREVLSRTALGRSDLYARIKKGTFPSPVRLGPQKVAWSEPVVESWIASAIAGGAQ